MITQLHWERTSGQYLYTGPRKHCSSTNKHIKWIFWKELNRWNSFILKNCYKVWYEEHQELFISVKTSHNVAGHFAQDCTQTEKNSLQFFMATSKPTPKLSAEESMKRQQRWELHFETWASLQFCAEQISKVEISKRNRAQSAKTHLFPKSALIKFGREAVWGPVSWTESSSLMHYLRSGDRDNT